MRHLTATIARRSAGFLRSRRHQRVLASSGERDLLQITTAEGFPGQKRIVEKVWQEFFSDPSQWWDHRSEKVNPRYPDFKHKTTQQALWLNGKSNPPWVEAKLAAMVPGSVQLSIFQWNAKLARCALAGHYGKTMELFQQMQQKGFIPNSFTFVQVLKACSSSQALEKGRCVHKQIIQCGFETDVFVGNSLIDMYVKSGSIHDAQLVFNRMVTCDVVSWNAMILGHVKCGQAPEALKLFQQMQLEHVTPDTVTFVGLLNACASIAALKEGRCVHEQITQSGCEFDVFVGTSLIDMYAKCGSIEDAQRVFNRMTTRNVVSWNAMILGLVKCGLGWRALELSQKMQCAGVQPDSVTFVGMLNACASLGALEEGRYIHDQIVQNGCQSDIFVGSSLVDMYAKCGVIEDAQRVFNRMKTHNVVSWNAMILGHVKHGQGQRALELSQQMQYEGVQPDPGTFVGVLNACASIGSLEEGRHIHEQIIQSGFESDAFVHSSLVDMYAKCGAIEDAHRVFNRMATHNVVSWNAMILGYVKCRHGQKALELFKQLQCKGVQADPVTFVGVLNACTIVGALEEGKHVHEQIIQCGFQSDAFVSNSLVDMYVKCGAVEDAQRVFNMMTTHNVAAWNALLGGYAMHGEAKKALGHFEHMCQENVEIDVITFIALLQACSHAGLLYEGLNYFESMDLVYNVTATLDHYACMVDLLGRAGLLHEAEDLIIMTPCAQDAALWKTLLGACRSHGDVDMGERIARKVLVLDPGSATGYVLLANIYAAAGRWDLSVGVRQQRLEKAVTKQPQVTRLW